MYVNYAAPGSVPPESQILQLEQDRQRANGSRKRLPPGWHAHLGYLYAQVGRLDDAVRELNTEKQAFPESTAMVDTLLSNMNKNLGTP
jgi:hypothetical protein